MIVAVPPEPVAALGNVNLFPGPSNTLGEVLLSRPAAQVFPRLVQRIPGRVVFFMPDPDGEVVVNPAARRQSRQRIPRRVVYQVFPQLDRANLRNLRASLIQ